MLDSIHRGGEAFIVTLVIDIYGKKLALGFWQGATENGHICNALLADLERRGIKLSQEIIFVTDGGSCVIKSLRDRFGDQLIYLTKVETFRSTWPKKQQRSLQALQSGLRKNKLF